jgi:hypothetical protein
MQRLSKLRAGVQYRERRDARREGAEVRLEGGKG